MTGVSRALVLGGGGPLGIAWEAGMLQGWADAWPGNAIARPNASPLGALLQGRIIGTSAGSIVGTHLAVSGSVQALFTAQGEPAKDMPAQVGIRRFLLFFSVARLLGRSPLGIRRWMGRAARWLPVRDEEEWLDVIARTYLPEGSWPPDRDLRITAVDAQEGTFRIFDREDDVPLALAVAASCAVPCTFPLVRVGGRRYMDGGIPSPTNAGAAQGCERIIVLDPLGRMFGRYAPLHRERAALEAAGSRTLTFAPDDSVHTTMAGKLFDLTRRARVAELARAQGRITAGEVWRFLHEAPRL